MASIVEDILHKAISEDEDTATLNIAGLHIFPLLCTSRRGKVIIFSHPSIGCEVFLPLLIMQPRSFASHGPKLPSRNGQ